MCIYIYIISSSIIIISIHFLMRGRKAANDRVGWECARECAGRYLASAWDAEHLRGIEDNCPKLVFGSTNKRNPM